MIIDLMTHFISWHCSEWLLLRNYQSLLEIQLQVFANSYQPRWMTGDGEEGRGRRCYGAVEPVVCHQVSIAQPIPQALRSDFLQSTNRGRDLCLGAAPTKLWTLHHWAFSSRKGTPCHPLSLSDIQFILATRWQHSNTHLGRNLYFAMGKEVWRHRFQEF